MYEPKNEIDTIHQVIQFLHMSNTNEIISHHLTYNYIYALVLLKLNHLYRWVKCTYVSWYESSSSIWHKTKQYHINILSHSHVHSTYKYPWALG